MAEMTIKRFGVFSVAKMYGLLMFVAGLIIGVIYGVVLIVFGAAITGLSPGEGAAAQGDDLGGVVEGERAGDAGGGDLALAVADDGGGVDAEGAPEGDGAATRPVR